MRMRVVCVCMHVLPRDVFGFLPTFQVTQKEVVGALQQLAADGHVSYNERSQTVIARGT